MGSVTDVVAVTAVKSLPAAKSRLARDHDDPGTVADLVLAMLADTVAAIRAVDVVRAVYVVSPDPDVRAAAHRSGAVGVREPDGGGLNPALVAGAAAASAAHPGADVLAIQPDLPGLQPAELTAFLAAAGGRRAFVPDRQGTGTAALLAPRGSRLDPRFGVGSSARHQDSGAVMLAGAWPGLRGDVDTAADLADIADRLGARTAAAVRSNGVGTGAADAAGATAPGDTVPAARGEAVSATSTACVVRSGRVRPEHGTE